MGEPFHRGSKDESRNYTLPPDWMEADAHRLAKIHEACRLHLIDLETYVGRPLTEHIPTRFVTHRCREIVLR
jgi:hypothetical protein